MAPAQVIDAHHHWIPPEHLDALPSFLRDGEALLRRDDRTSLMRAGQAINNFNETVVGDADLHLSDMDAAGVDRAIFSLGIWLEWMDLKHAQEVNDMLADLQSRSKGRIVGLVHVPPLADGAEQEIERGVRELGLRGINLTTHWRGTYFYEPLCRGILRKAAELEVPIVIHASSVAGVCPAIDDDGTQFGRVTDQAMVVVRLLMSGALEELPKLRFVLPQMGGGFFAIKKRIGVGGDETNTLTARAGGLHQIWFDTAPGLWDADEFRLALANLGADQLLFGTDYPSRRHWLKRAADTWRAMDIDEGNREKVMGRNAAALFGI
jgi:predicted TIM-barrel fold metal-dependent hydrolase